MNIIDEASYGRIYQHTRDNGTFAIIGSEDKDTHKDRYNELKQLIKRYSKYYDHLGYNKLSGTYQYKLTGDVTNEKPVIIYGISKKDALSIAKKINQESIIWKENTFFGIIDVKGNIIERFKKSALNFSKAIKQGIGSRLQSDQSRTFGYAFEGRIIMRKNKLTESVLSNLIESEEDINYDKSKENLNSLCKTIENILKQCNANISYVNSSLDPTAEIANRIDISYKVGADTISKYSNDIEVHGTLYFDDDLKLESADLIIPSGPNVLNYDFIRSLNALYEFFESDMNHYTI